MLLAWKNAHRLEASTFLAIDSVCAPLPSVSDSARNSAITAINSAIFLFSPDTCSACSACSMLSCALMNLPPASGLNDGLNFKFNARVKQHLDRCLKGFFRRVLYTRGMTFADFIAGAFWPVIIVFGLLLRTVRAPDVRPLITWSAAAVGFVYLLLGIIYRDTSLIAITDSNLLLGGLGVGIV